MKWRNDDEQKEYETWKMKWQWNTAEQKIIDNEELMKWTMKTNEEMMKLW